LPHFRVVTSDGDALGQMEFAVPDWPNGSIIYGATARTSAWSMSSRATTPEVYIVLVVEPVNTAPPHD
jgi:hypothetical protein